jgi:hypothetical protein
MASDPRLNLFNFAGTILNQNPAVFGVPHAVGCPSVLQRQQTAIQSASLGLSSTIGLVGSFANLAAGVGGGAVGAGLSTLAGVSNAVRIGGMSQLPQSAIGNGQSYVLNTLGINSQQLNTAGQFNPSIANNALGAASQVYNSVSQGKFTPNDIPAVFSAFQNGAALISSLFTGPSAASPNNSQFGQTCGVGNYATDLIKLAPKYKFLFVVDFEFDPAFNNILGRSGGRIDPAFVIKSTTRPAVEFEYQEVNMYNFRTKVPARTTYEPITMKFLDDDRNNAVQFYNAYLKLISPIANLNPHSVQMDPLQLYDLAGGGMGFEGSSAPINASWNSPTTGKLYSASLGTFGTNSTTNVLRRISIFHVYRQGTLMNQYHFFNPKITKMELDELDMASSEGAEVSLTFSYDSLYVIPGFQIFNPNAPSSYNLHDMTSDGLFPLGADPTTSIQNWNQKDGFGLASANTTLSADKSVLQTELNTNTGTISTTTSINGSNLTIRNDSINPTLGSGASYGVQTNISGLNDPPSFVDQNASNIPTLPPSTNSTTDPSSLTTSTTASIDPITGTTPTSANTATTLSNVSTNAEQQNTAVQSQLSTSTAAATTPEQLAAAQQTAANATANIKNTSNITSGSITNPTPGSNPLNSTGGTSGSS